MPDESSNSLSSRELMRKHESLTAAGKTGRSGNESSNSLRAHESQGERMRVWGQTGTKIDESSN